MRKCLEFTGCDAVMSSEALLEYPALFSGRLDVPQEQIAREYLGWVNEFPESADLKCVKSHMFRDETLLLFLPTRFWILRFGRIYLRTHFWNVIVDG